jgi:hypothetical protein
MSEDDEQPIHDNFAGERAIKIGVALFDATFKKSFPHQELPPLSNQRKFEISGVIRLLWELASENYEQIRQKADEGMKLFAEIIRAARIFRASDDTLELMLLANGYPAELLEKFRALANFDAATLTSEQMDQISAVETELARQ